MSHTSISRRQVLRGAGGFTLGLPLLPSLLPRRAEAAATPRPRIAFFNQQQGGYWLHLNPPDAFATQKVQLHPGHEIAWAPLRRDPVDGGKVGISKIIQADPRVLTERMLRKVNLLRGIDHTWSHGHNNASFGSTHPVSQPSVDQVVAWSSAFYAAGEFRERSIVTGSGPQNSFYFSSPLTRSGKIVAPTRLHEPRRLFDQLFKGVRPADPAAPAPAAPTRRPVVDLLYDSYRELRDGKRISADDRRRLGDHMEQLSELQRRVEGGGETSKPAAGCKPPASAALDAFTFPKERIFGYRSLADSKRLYQLYNDIIVAAYTCGITRVAAVVPSDDHDPFADYKSNWHDLAHATDKEDPKAALMYAASSQAFFEHVLLDLATKLDAIEEVPGQSYLDNTLIFCTQESSWDAHTQIDRMVLTIGNVNGYFKTGNFVDYRNRAKPKVDHAGPKDAYPFFPGILVNQWWANVLQALPFR
jgi:hypothetical protein